MWHGTSEFTVIMRLSKALPAFHGHAMTSCLHCCMTKPEALLLQMCHVMLCVSRNHLSSCWYCLTDHIHFLWTFNVPSCTVSENVDEATKLITPPILGAPSEGDSIETSRFTTSDDWVPRLPQYNTSMRQTDGDPAIFSHLRSDGWPHHGRTFSIYLCPLSLWLTLPRIVMSMYWCCLSRLCIVFLACMPLALFLALSLSPGNSLVS